MASPSVSTLLLAVWAYLHLFQHGIHVSALNGLHEALTCGLSGGEVDPRATGPRGLQSCVPMLASEFGLVTAAFTIGGLFGSLSSDTVTRRVGRVKTLQISTVFFALGSFCIGTANSVTRLILGRILAGGGAGLASVTVPLYLAELAPDLRGILSILAQLAVTSGVLTGQLISFPYASPLIWRKAMFIPFGLSMVQLFGSTFALGAGRRRMAEMSDKGLLGGNEKLDLVEQEGLAPLRVLDIISSPDQRITRGLLIVIVTQMSQQLCGITPVMSFSTRILTPVFKANSRYIATMMIIPKLPITLIPAFLLKRMTPRQLLCHSCYWTAGSALVLAIGLNTDTPLLSILGISVFVSAFSFGLGPVTVVVLSEVLPPHARTAAGSIGVALNWSTSAVMASIFLPLQQSLKTGPDSGDGNIFMLFSPICLAASVAITMSYRSLERGQKV